MADGNRGQVSVYACGMLCVFLVLVLTVLQGIRIWEGKAKCSQSLVGAVSSIKGDYQPDLFRRYHLLALDRTYYGRGEGYLEERVREYLNYNLNPGNSLYQYRVADVMLTETRPLLEEDLSGFKQQIQEYMMIKLPLNLVDAVLDKTEQGSGEAKEDDLTGVFEKIPNASENEEFSYEDIGEISGEDIKALGLEEALYEAGITDFESLTVEDLLQADLGGQGKLSDPRDDYEVIRSSDILSVIIPEQAGEISKEPMNLQEVPSAEMRTDGIGFFWDGLPALQSMEDITGMSFDDRLHLEGLSNIGMEELYGVAYALDSFQYRGHPLDAGNAGEYHALEYEVEYIVAGGDSDYVNLSTIAEELTWIRFVPNAVYAFQNESMKKEALLLATLLLAPFQLEAAAEPVSYVLVACWTYGESLLDVRALLQGQSVPFTKDSSTWQLSLNGLKNLASQETKDCEQDQGMNYSEYLTVLLAVMPDKNLQYYRMLDIMEWNLQESIPGFELKNCVLGFKLQTEIMENGRLWYLEQDGSYLPES